MRRLLAAVLLAAACCVGAVHAVPARAAGCVAPSIAVLVDFGGGTVQRACTGPGGTGLSVLSRTFGYTTVTGEPFVCQIAGRPKSQCKHTPPATAYWAYFHVLPGHSSWSYSSLGAGSYTPPAGSAEGWAFGGGRAPNYPAGSALPTKPAPPPYTAPKPRPTATRTTTTTESPPRLPSTSVTVPTQSRTAASRPPATSSRSGSATPAPTPGASVEPTAAVASVRDVPARATGKPQHRSPVPTILGLSVVGVLAAVAAVLMVRRRDEL
jgi:hypothetical protein